MSFLWILTLNHLLSDEGSTLTFDSALGTNDDPNMNYSCSLY